MGTRAKLLDKQGRIATVRAGTASRRRYLVLTELPSDELIDNKSNFADLTTLTKHLSRPE